MKILSNYNLKNYNTFNVEAETKFFVRCSSAEEIKELLTEKKFVENKHLIIGKGSNILFTKNFNGLVISPDIQGVTIISEAPEYVKIKVSSGESWDNFVNFCVEKKYYGVENLSWIPGNVGAAAFQNIGAYGVEAKDIIETVEAINIKNGKIEKFRNSECKFGYRTSLFKEKFENQYIIVAVIFNLRKNKYFTLDYQGLKEELKKFDKKNIRTIRQAVINLRKSKLPDPKILGNGGSFFKNPLIDKIKLAELIEKFDNVPFFKLAEQKYKIPAAWLIEKAGWRGKKVGNAGSHSKHALVIVNYGNATGREIWYFFIGRGEDLIIYNKSLLVIARALE